MFLGRVAYLVAVWAYSVYSQESDEDIDTPEQETLTVEQVKKLHVKVDKNEDGKASLEEFLAYSKHMRKELAKKDIKTILDEMDGDKDGKLSLSELLKDMDQWDEGDEQEKKEAQERKNLEEAKFKASDENNDGFLELSEMPSLFYPETQDSVLELTAKSTLQQKDKDGDGLLTEREFWDGDINETTDEPVPISDEEKEDFKKLDVNRDGKLELAELKQWESGVYHTSEAMRKLFDAIDTDKDNHVSSAELENGREKMAGMVPNTI